jgi:hypothetical protein
MHGILAQTTKPPSSGTVAVMASGQGSGLNMRKRAQGKRSTPDEKIPWLKKSVL